MLFVQYNFVLGKKSQQFTDLKQQKIENKSAGEMVRKIIHRSERFWQEIVFVLIYFLYTKTIHKSSIRRFDKSEFFPHKTNFFLHILPSKIVN